MNENEPTLDEWRELFAASLAFYKLRSWEWMWDSDVVAVQDPETGQYGFGCVMGRAGEYLGFALYRGAEGLLVIREMQSGRLSPDDPEHLYRQNELLLGFVDRGDLDKDDLRLIRDVGLKFRGRSAWPQFRSLLPGYHPWFLTGPEARFLTVAIRQVMDVAVRFKEDPDLIPPFNGADFRGRTNAESKGRRAWRDIWLEAQHIEPEEKPPVPVDPGRLAAIAESAVQRQGVWEIDSFYSPKAVLDKKGERPYYPKIFLCVDQKSELILATVLAGPEDYHEEHVESFVSLLEQIHAIPREIQARADEALIMIEEVTEALDIRAVKTARLRVLGEIKANLLDYLMRE